jgi:hypothetical protein
LVGPSLNEDVEPIVSDAGIPCEIDPIEVVSVRRLSACCGHKGDDEHLEGIRMAPVKLVPRRRDNAGTARLLQVKEPEPAKPLSDEIRSLIKGAALQAKTLTFVVEQLGDYLRQQSRRFPLYFLPAQLHKKRPLPFSAERLF